ncbi:sugar ABC transporter permease [Candidatus Atribacteria bacterium HGW-Atribacteria-1]|nr:MAG: sugar ABC transporter permease [Candidatus Atribacteria bacterium HGW-Atribacteria-1]
MARFKIMKTAYLFILPTLLIFSIFILYSIGGSFFVSLHKWDGLRPMKYIGLSNYFKLFYDPLFLNSVKNTLIWIVLFTSLSVILGLLIAVLLETAGRGTIVFKSIIFLPMAISAVAGGILWSFMYDPDFGAVNAFLKWIGLDFLTRAWLGDSHTALYAVIIAYVWMWTGFCMIVFSAGLKGIPPELLEVAKIDGANSWQQFWHVVLPLLKGSLGVAIIMTVTSGLKAFDLIYTMTSGGPFRSSEVVAYFMYIESFYHYKMGYGAAIAIGLFIIVFIVAVPLVRRMVKT